MRWTTASLLLLTCATVVAGPSAEVLPTHTFSRSATLEVTALDAERAPIRGVTVHLCPYAGSGFALPSTEDGCRVAGSDVSGRSRFEAVAPGEYVVVGELSGFAATAIYPLFIGGEDPIAPDQVFLILNPVCWDC